MKIEKQEFDRFAAEVKAEMGEDFVNVLDAVAQTGQFAFATNEPDRGGGVRGKWLDPIKTKLEKYGWDRVPCMPFPVSGRLMYVLASLKYAG